MIPSRPYLLRAFYDWIVDNDLTAHVIVDATLPGVDVPSKYVDPSGRIVLNMSPRAVTYLSLENEYISFEARFSGVPHPIYIPMRAVKGIYAKENNHGLEFKAEDYDQMPGVSDLYKRVLTGAKAKLVKVPETAKSAAEVSDDEDGDKGGGSGGGTPRGRPTLTVIK